MNRTSSESLPSWAPDWLSGDIPSQAYDVADGTAQRHKTRSFLDDSVRRDISMGDGKLLRVRGIAICKIAALTSSTRPTESFTPDPSTSIVRKPTKLRKRTHPRDVDTSALSSHSSPSFYYPGPEVLTALLSCLLIRRQIWNSWILYHGIHLDWHAFCLQCVPSEPNIRSNRIFLEWLETNAAFHIQGRTLERLTKETDSSWFICLFRVLDSPLAIPFITLILFGTITSNVMITFTLVVHLPIKWKSIAYIIPIPGALLLFLEISYLINYYTSCRCSDDRTSLMKPGKRLIVSDKGHLGIVDERAKAGDALFHLHDSSELSVLRMVGGPGDTVQQRGRDKYTIVGKCHYIHLRDADRGVYLGPDQPSPGDSRSEYKEAEQKWVTKTEEEGLFLKIDSI